MAAAGTMMMPDTHSAAHGDSGDYGGTATSSDYLGGTNMARPGGRSHVATLPGAETLDSHILGASAKPRLTEDEKLFKEVERRRKYDMERRTRLFDAKCRTMGVDKDALDAQVLEKQQRRREELMHSRREDKAFITTGKMIQMADLDKQRVRRQAERECKDFSITHLSAEQRRDFDLNNPHHLKHTLPDRMGDDDERCGPASMQRFAGEDLMGAERIRQQQMAMAATIEQQKFEKTMIAMANHPNHNGEAEQGAAVRALADEMEMQNGALRRETNTNLRNANVQQAADDVVRKMSLAEQEQEHNQRELDFHANDHVLNETTPSYHGARVRRDMFKGSNREQRIAAAQDMLDQANEQHMTRQGSHYENRMFEHDTERTRKLLLQAEREKARSRRQAATAMASENQRLAQGQKAANIKRAQDNTNKYSDEFWDQFTNQIR